MELNYLKAVHIIFVVTWFAGLFYLPRLMVYAAEANQLPDETAKGILLSQYQLMKKRLLSASWPRHYYFAAWNPLVNDLSVDRMAESKAHFCTHFVPVSFFLTNNF
jgi:uncharacterized membrane protein